MAPEIDNFDSKFKKVNLNAKIILDKFTNPVQV